MDRRVRTEGTAAARRLAARLAAVEVSCDLTWWHLLSEGFVTSDPDDPVTCTLRRILDEARAA
jgi:hypothetical protein